MNDIADSVLATELAARARRGSVIFIARSEAQAGRLAAASRVLAPRAGLVSLPAWDCLPYDRVAPSRGVMGRRMAALRRLSEPGPHLLVASVAALAQRLPPPRSAAVLTLARAMRWTRRRWPPSCTESATRRRQPPRRRAKSPWAAR